MSALVCQLLCVLLCHVVDGVDLRLRMPLPDGARVSAGQHKHYFEKTDNFAGLPALLMPIADTELYVGTRK